MAKYKVKPGYCLHLPNRVFAESGEEIELTGELEQEILASQGWKIGAVLPEPEKVKVKESGTEAKEVSEPPKDRAIKEAKAK